ncbi:carboxylating nicotinate-nucleotide diphosphorylase [Effusibacillus lacus]|uniref:Probable nicotinate-nucleotide pyrophosphorylase [carboxylating] n=1 Tax=Effusibacillus lacus TaxID=1348429 RepID=A0A292YPD5_9BACL|nr:carboxylating nicotinate-nucleotide diphosphorylase [Effusibacillus lacus]TCS72070.1 nicotinate-nucleotide pyrophosphorylase [carboxylating] [Effusibacillus lacus]GAX90355.1 nicotinate-nucleotide diphosphorylase [Effusibacillus lacus]
MNPLLVRQFLRQALIEDIGSRDLTTEILFEPAAGMQAFLVAKQEGRIAGLEVAEDTFRLLDPNVQFEVHIQDGTDVETGTILASIRGTARAVLSAERVALNMLQRMSGIATTTRNVCRKVADLPVKITDTRKTVPGLRIFDKYAVATGGAVNHRFGLYDAVMIKDNHIAAAGSLSKALEKIKNGIGHLVKIEVEADTLVQVREAAEFGVDVILLDNMTPAMIAEAVEIVKGRAITEASGGITPDNVRDYAVTGVDVISLGWLTHSVKALDISLDTAPIK